MGGGDCSDVANAEVSSKGKAAVTVNVRCSNGSKISVQTPLDSTVGVFKEFIGGSCEVPAPQQRLIYKGRILKDDQTLESYGVEADHTIHLVRGSANPLTGAPKTPTTAQSTQGATGNPLSGESGSMGGAGFGDSLFPGLGALGGNGTSGLFGVALPELEQMQQQLAQNPNMMREIMNMPVIQNLMNNPDLMRNFIMNSPQIRELIDRNPDLAHILNDPSTLRQTMEAARNPELMREMMRNTDRAMSNIESSPEGFNMLRRMYETVQEPFLNAATMAGDSGTGLGSNRAAASLGNQGAANARDRSTNPSTTGSEAAGSPAPNTNPLPNPWSNAAGGGGQANNTRPDARTPGPGIAGLSGLGLPNLDQMIGGMHDSSPFSQLLQNPAVAQMMQTLLSNPQYMNQMLNLNPETRNLLEANSQFREALQNPELLQQLTSPETLRQLQTFWQLFSSLGLQSPGQEQNQTGTAGTGTPNMGLDFLMNMFGGGNGAAGLGVPNPSNVPPEELYATQLSQLQEMGFFDTQENIRALSATAGNVHAAVERLLGNLGQ